MQVEKWWKNIPQHSVGDLVYNKTRYRRLTEEGGYEPYLFVVLEAKPKKPCRVNPVQKIRLMRCSDGFITRWSEAKGWSNVLNRSE